MAVASANFESAVVIHTVATYNTLLYGDMQIAAAEAESCPNEMQYKRLHSFHIAYSFLNRADYEESHARCSACKLSSP